MSVFRKYSIAACVVFLFFSIPFVIMFGLVDVNSIVSDSAVTEGYEDLNATGYVVYKDGEKVGTLMGSFHEQLNYDEQDCFKKMFTHQIKKDNSTVFMEIPMESVPAGGVDASLVHAAYYDPEIEKRFFELADVQYAFIGRAFIVGDKIKYFPLSYTFISQHPTLIHCFLKVVQPYIQLYNQVYDLYTGQVHSSIVLERTKNILEGKPALFREYMRGLALDRIEASDRELLCMKDRDQLYVKILTAQEGNWLALVGFMHLAGEYSMPRLLRDKGYDLVPLDVYKKAIEYRDEVS